MRRHVISGLASGIVGLMFTGAALWAFAGDDVEVAIYGKGEERQAAITRLRQEGPEGLDRLLARVLVLDRERGTGPELPIWTEARGSLENAIEQVGGARYCRQSQLYWYTDPARAAAAAKAQGKPILALRLLGQLTDEYSCANSRFFRSTLYANSEISRYLRENYILTWKSVRPVPRITIDFGDGRQLHRTLTGNSIHYVLTPEGDVVDALPGLYGPQAFLDRLRQAHAVAQEAATWPSTERAARLTQWHLSQASEIADRWEADLSAPISTADAATPAVSQVDTTVRRSLIAAPAAGDPSALADAVAQRLVRLARQMNDERWEQLAIRHAPSAELDEASREIIRAQQVMAVRAGRLAITKMVVEDPLLRIVRNLQHSIALDTVRNEYTFRPRIHLWLSTASESAAHIDVLNDRVYADLFLMPAADPWLGLAPPDVYTALPHNGVTVSQ